VTLSKSLGDRVPGGFWGDLLLFRALYIVSPWFPFSNSSKQLHRLTPTGRLAQPTSAQHYHQPLHTIVDFFLHYHNPLHIIIDFFSLTYHSHLYLVFDFFLRCLRPLLTLSSTSSYIVVEFWTPPSHVSVNVCTPPSHLIINTFPFLDSQHNPPFLNRNHVPRQLSPSTLWPCDRAGGRAQEEHQVLAKVLEGLDTWESDNHSHGASGGAC